MVTIPQAIHILLPSNATCRRCTSPTARAIASALLTGADHHAAAAAAATTTIRKMAEAMVPKSILKSRSTESSTSSLLTEQRCGRTDAQSTSSNGGRVIERLHHLRPSLHVSRPPNRVKGRNPRLYNVPVTNEVRRESIPCLPILSHAL